MSTSKRDAMQSSSVEVPASTSNLGPGFDFLGLAVALFLKVRVVARSATRHRVSRALGSAAEWPQSEDNLLFRAYDFAAARLGSAPMQLEFEVSSEIPIARGIGSSGAAVAAGILLAAAAADRKSEVDDWLAWGTELEHHPDNVCAAILGGCTLSVPLPDGRIKVVRQALHARLGFVLAWPEVRLATPDARRVLPRDVPFRDAVENPRRLALLLEGLRAGDPELLRLGSVDRLHVGYRLACIPGGREAIEAAYASGAWLATISGSGTALFAIAAREATAAVGEAMRSALAAAGSPAQCRVVEPVFGTPVVHRDD